MELMEEVKGYSDSREEEEEEEAAEIITIRREESNGKHHYPFSSPYSTANYASTPHHQNPWLGMHHHHHHHHESPDGTTTTESHNSSPCGLGLHQQDAAAANFMNHRKQQQLDFMDLSLGTNKDDEPNFQQPSSAAAGGCSSSSHHHGHGASSSSSSEPVEKEHMFDKVVTPSDVGKLNRLVIPKQHAEKYFPLDSSSNEKGLLLNFEDRNGKLWRFRYSYWNSSQSYVMTKGWSRFVKEKKLDAGDIVSFQRGLGELCRHRLYIDWRRRPDHPPDPSAPLITPLFLNQYSIRWGGRLYSLPSPQASTVPHRHHDHFQHLNYNHMYAFHHQQQQQHQQQYHHHVGGSGSGSHLHSYSELNSGSGSLYYLRSTPSMSMVDQNLPGQQQERGTLAPMIIDSVPVAHHHHHHHHHHGVVASSSSNRSTAGKRLRLFGVNMECASSPAEDHVAMANSLPSSSSLPPLQRLRLPHEDPRSSSSARFGDQRGGTSVLFDLDPSLQYRQ